MKHAIKNFKWSQQDSSISSIFHQSFRFSIFISIAIRLSFTLGCISIQWVFRPNIDHIFHSSCINLSSFIVVKVLTSSWSSLDLMSFSSATFILLLNPRCSSFTINNYFILFLTILVWVATIHFIQILEMLIIINSWFCLRLILFFF